MRGGKFPTNFLGGFCLCVAVFVAAEARAAQDTKPQISITANHEQFIPGEPITFDVTITLPEPVQDMQVKGFYPTPDVEVQLTQTGPLSYRYDATAALPEGVRMLKVTVYGRKKPNAPVTPMSSTLKNVQVKAVTTDLTDNRLVLSSMGDTPDPFSAVVKGENTFRGTYALQLANAEEPRLRQLVIIRNARNGAVRDLETVVELQAAVTTAEVLSHWDGKNGAGQMLPDAVYAYEAAGILYSHKETAGSVVEQILGVTSPKTGDITLDNTPPTISATQDPPPNAAAWNNTDVKVTFTAEDNLSGIAEVTQPVTVSQEGKDIEVQGKAVDKAGNEATLVYNVSIDKAPPALTATQEPLPNAKGWNRTDVLVTFQAQDELSGVAEFTAPVTVTEEGEDIEVPGSATDNAGNTGYAMPTVSIDKTAPEITGLTPADGFEVTTATPEIAATLTDALSGVDPDSIELKLDGAVVGHSYDPETGAVNYTPAEALADGQHTVSLRCEDMADNPAEASSRFGVSTTPPPPQDTMPPETIVIQTPEPNEAGWNNTDVTLEFEATDDLSGVAHTYVKLDEAEAQDTTELVISDEGEHTVLFWSVDEAGNVEQHHTLAVNVDKSAPVTEALVQGEAGYGGYYWDQVDVAVGARDSLSGVTEMHIVVDGQDSGTPLTLTGEGEHVITYWSADAAGNIEPEQELRLWLLTEDGDLDGDGDPNGFEREIGTQVDDAGSGLAGGAGRIFMSYVWRMESGKTTRLFNVVPPAGGGTALIGEDEESLDLPEPLWMTDQTLGVSFTANVRGEVVNGFVPQPGQSVQFQGFKECTFFSHPCVWAIYGSIYEENGVAKVTGEAYTGLFVDWHSTINKDRKIPLPMEEPTEVGTVVVQTMGAGPVEISFEEGNKYFGLLMNCAPIRTDMDMSVGGCLTFGESKSQQAPTCGLDPEPGTVVGVACNLPAEPEGFQGLNADRTVSLAWPDGMFECLNPQEGQDAHTRVGKGSGTFGWQLKRLDAPMPENASISAWVDSVGAGHPDVIPVSIGGVDVRPAGRGDIEHSPGEPVVEVFSFSKPVVYFNRDPVIVGIGDNRTSETPAYPRTTPSNYPYRLEAVISPGDAAGLVQFETTDANRAVVSVTSGHAGLATTHLVLKVTGKTPTPAQAGEPGQPPVPVPGDCYVTAVCGKQKLELQRTSVIVLKPTKIGKPYPSASGKATIMANMVVDANTSPAYTGPLQKGFVKLASLYGQKLTVTVWDQFDKPLDRIYAGAPISENNVPSNQFLTQSGTYTDPVGNWWFPPISEVPERSDAARKWSLEPMLPLQAFYSSRPALQVEVDGIPLELAPGRTVVGTPPDQIEVLW